MYLLLFLLLSFSRLSARLIHVGRPDCLVLIRVNLIFFLKEITGGNLHV